jgi:hypothetical protein
METHRNLLKESCTDIASTSPSDWFRLYSCATRHSKVIARFVVQIACTSIVSERTIEN